MASKGLTCFEGGEGSWTWAWAWDVTSGGRSTNPLYQQGGPGHNVPQQGQHHVMKASPQHKHPSARSQLLAGWDGMATPSPGGITSLYPPR